MKERNANERHWVAQFGLDVTGSVEARMIGSTSLDEAPRAAEHRVARRLLISLRDEAIWQFHTRGLRGFLFWAADHSITFRPQLDVWEWIAFEARHVQARLSVLLESYKPENEAVVWSEHRDGDEVFRISAEGNREDVCWAGKVAITSC